MRPTYPTNRLHNQHPPPPASESREQPNRAAIRGSILDADSPVQGVKIARRNTPVANENSAFTTAPRPRCRYNGRGETVTMRRFSVMVFVIVLAGCGGQPLTP